MHINWGDVPTWLADVVAAVGGGAALRQLRQQGNVIEDEIECNRTRDAPVARTARAREVAPARTGRGG